MMPILEKLLKKRGINSIEELREDEKEVFDRWDKVLSDGDITLEKVVQFCNGQIASIEDRWKDLNAPQEKNERLIIHHTVYRTIRDIITKPQAERANLEKYLNSLLT